MDVSLQIVPIAELTPAQEETVRRLNEGCFVDVSQEAAEEDYVTESFAKLFAIAGDRIIGTLSLKQREIVFDGRRISVGGIGGVCVAAAMRGQGIGRRMVEKAITILAGEQCDIACLNADPLKPAHKLYERLGFVFMQRPISFENTKGELKYDSGTMFRPIHSPALYDLVMHSDSTFHYGKGYW